MPRARTLRGLVVEIAQTRGSASTIRCGPESLGWDAVAERVHRLAVGLTRLGIRPGDRVAVLMGNRPEWVLLDLAVATMGGIFMGLNTWYQLADLRYV